MKYLKENWGGGAGLGGGERGGDWGDLDELCCQDQASDVQPQEYQSLYTLRPEIN